MYRKDKISIIIPVYNRLKELKRTLLSVLSQTFTNYEILIIDDGSEENIDQFIDTLKIDCIKYFRIDHQNANVARNHGIKNSTGEYIAMLDADDEWLNDHLETNLRIMQSTPCDGIYSSIIIKSPTGEHIFKVRQLESNEKMVNYLLSSQIGAHTSTLFMKSETVKMIMWDETLRRHQDYDFVVRFSKSFYWYANLKTSAIYHFKDWRGKFIDFDSCMAFIHKYKEDIEPAIYRRYHKEMLGVAQRLNADGKIISHYQEHSNICL